MIFRYTVKLDCRKTIERELSNENLLPIRYKNFENNFYKDLVDRSMQRVNKLS